MSRDSESSEILAKRRLCYSRYSRVARDDNRRIRGAMTEPTALDNLPWESLTRREQFHELLLAVRDAAASPITAPETPNEARGDARAVWRAAEVALGVLSDSYMPKREAVEVVESRLEGWRP